MEIVKFKKDHISGIEKGAIKELSLRHADRLKAEGYVESATSKNLESYNKKFSSVKIETKLEDVKSEVNSSNSDCEDCGSEPCKDCDEKLVSKKIKKTIKR